MDLSHHHSRRTVLQAGLAAAAAAMLPAAETKAQQSPPGPKKLGSTRISAICGDSPELNGGLGSIMQHLPNADYWWANNYSPITPGILNDTDLLLTYYSGDMYTKENAAAIIDNITNRGMGWICVHNTHWFVGDALYEFIGAYPMLHKQIQPVAIVKLHQGHPITKGIEPFVIQLDEQFGAYLVNPKDPNLTVLFWSHGLHDDHWTIQGWCVQRGKGRIVGLTPGHYAWTWNEDEYKEIMWRAAQWALNLEIKPFFGNYENVIW
ncbi:MAG: ThuA domain-containing protein [Candidatus Latescibacterota bacterium]